ncbi:MAG TPA: bacillithiol biosynthesis BshC, partial [Dongiaceae bacterium]|nr:bacillithiol biosynthesis BshC [Dongiaceae bacterium]
MTEALSKDMHEVARPRHLSRELLARWETSLREWNAPARVLDSWRALDDPRTRIVVTGQQPGPWGGPLYTFYKAATAIALAERIAARDQVPAVSVFWMQSEDTDWGEIGWGALPHRDLRLYRHRFDAAVPARHWVGSARVADPPEARSLVEEWGEDLGD